MIINNLVGPPTIFDSKLSIRKTCLLQISTFLILFHVNLVQVEQQLHRRVSQVVISIPFSSLKMV